MERRASVSIEVPGLALSFDGDEALFDREVKPILDGVVRGTWRKSGPLPVAPEGPEGPEEFPSPAAGGPPRAAAPSCQAYLRRQGVRGCPLEEREHHGGSCRARRRRKTSPRRRETMLFEGRRGWPSHGSACS